ncbi:MAG: hypothetical protein ACE5JD_07745 [Candidatus Methylomirabilia bacterium]
MHTAVPKTFRELVSEAESIVVARVTGTRALQLESGVIVTDVALEVLLAVKGPREPLMTLRMPGGRIGDREVMIDGAPAFQADQILLLFVRGNMVDVVPFVGAQEAVFYVITDPSGIGRVFTSLGRPVVAIWAGEVRTGQPGATALSLSQFLTHIEMELGR